MVTAGADGLVTEISSGILKPGKAGMGPCMLVWDLKYVGMGPYTAVDIFIFITALIKKNSSSLLHRSF
jgi:hypothetical protein